MYPLFFALTSLEYEVQFYIDWNSNWNDSTLLGHKWIKLGQYLDIIKNRDIIS